MSDHPAPTRIVPPDRAAIRAALEITGERAPKRPRGMRRRGLALLGAAAIGVGVALSGTRDVEAHRSQQIAGRSQEAVQVVDVTADGPLAEATSRRERRAVVRLRLATKEGAIVVDDVRRAIRAWLGESSSHQVLLAAAGADIDLREKIAAALHLASPAALALDWESLELR